MLHYFVKKCVRVFSVLFFNSFDSSQFDFAEIENLFSFLFFSFCFKTQHIFRAIKAVILAVQVHI